MKILLINKNAMVEKLVRLSAQKSGMELLTAENVADAAAGDYAWALVDNESLDGEGIETLRAKYSNAKIGLLYPKNGEEIEGFDLYIKKPLLPTDLTDEFAANKSDETPEELPSVDDDLALFDDNAADLGDLGDLSASDETQTTSPSGADTAQVEDLAPIEGDQAQEIDLIDQNDDLDLSVAQEKPADETQADQSANDENEPKTSVLDKEEIDEVKGLLDEINQEPQEKPSETPTDDLDAPQQEGLGDLDDLDDLNTTQQEGLGDLGDLDDLGVDTTQQEGLGDLDDLGDLNTTQEELKLDLGENGSLLDDEDLADLKQESAAEAEPEKSDAKEEEIADIDLGIEDANAPSEKFEISFDELPKNQDTIDENIAQETPAEEPIDDDFKISFDEIPLDPIDPIDQTPIVGELEELEEHTEQTPIAQEPKEETDDELSALGESDVALALGEKLELTPPQIEEDQEDESQETLKLTFGERADEGSEQSAQKSALESALAALPPNTLRELLDGMQLTINIAFPKKK
ncbi:MAG: hypothetical protein LBP89_05105 [Helicobacteraceae bacterium]|jgi:hypothetical protein|nr:hypothetical protein [Helicobacteraceae bacterium]